MSAATLWHAFLLDRGLDRGDRVALLTRNCIEFVEVELAAAKIGAISVNLNWRQTPAELAHCVCLTNRPLLSVARSLWRR